MAGNCSCVWQANKIGLADQMLKPDELKNARNRLLILSDTHGAKVEEVNPPGR